MRVLFILLALLSLLFHTNGIKAQTVNLNGLELWLKNDFGVIISGGFVTEWKDVSGNNNNCIQSNPAFQPTVNLNIPSINNYNSLVFDGIDDYLPFTSRITNIRTVFFVIKHNGINAPLAPILGDNAAYDFMGDDFANNIFSDTYTHPNIKNGNIRINKIAVATVTIAARPLNYSIISLTTLGNVSASQITRDRSNTNRVWGGEYSEVMIYNRLFSAIQIDSIENYLVNKYSPTLELGNNITVTPINGCTPSTSIIIQANPNFENYLWSNGNTSNQITVNQYGEYSVICSDIFGTQHFDTIKVIPTSKNFNYPTHILCGNGSITWDTQLNKTENTFNWQNNSTDSLFIINSPGQYFVTITDTLGCEYISNTLTVIQDNFSITASLGPDVSLCAGNSINLVSGTNPSLTYTWSTGSNNDSLLINTTNQYSVIVTNTNNCIAKDTINVTVLGQAPVANFSFGIGCFNSAVTFTNSSIPPEGNTITGTNWNFGDPLSPTNTSTLSNTFHTFLDTGTYYVNLKVLTDVGCENFITKTIHIAPTPTINFSNGISCQNDSTAFSSSIVSTPGYSITSTTWNFGDPASGTANTSNLSSPKHLFSNQTTYSVTLIATNNIGCVTSLTKSIIVKGQVTASFTNSPPCSNTAVIFQDNSTVPIPSSQFSRLWNFGTSTTTGLTASKTFTSSGVYSVTLTVTGTGTNNCSSKIAKQILVFQPPEANFTIPSFCSKDTITAINKSASQSGIISSYNWKLNNTYFSSVQNPTLTASTGTYSLKLIVSNSFNCKDSTTKPVTVLSLPNVDFNTNPTYYYYINSPINFIPTIINASSYLWDITTIPTSTVQSPSISFDNEGTYTVSLNLTDQSGCKNSKTKAITVFKKYLDMAVLNVNTIKDNDGFITVEANIANYGSVPITSFDIHYQISDAGNIKETWNGTLNPNAFYVYTFNAKSATQNNKSNNITCVEIEKANNSIDENIGNNTICNTLNIDEISVSNPIPNPTDGDITLPIILNNDIDFTIAVYNSTGQMVYEEVTQKGTTGLNFITLPTSVYSRGCYIIKTVIDSKIYIKKFIISK